MRIVTLEDHFATPMFNSVRPAMPGFEFILSSRSKYLGHDIEAELLDLAHSRIAAMDAAGVDLQVVSLSAPGCEALALCRHPATPLSAPLALRRCLCWSEALVRHFCGDFAELLLC